MGEMRLHVPMRVFKDRANTLAVEQEFQAGETGAGAAGIQFSNDPAGPWVTARPPGGGGAVEAAIVQYDDRTEGWMFNGVRFHELAHVRVGLWPDQSATGEPLVVSNVGRPRSFIQEHAGE